MAWEDDVGQSNDWFFYSVIDGFPFIWGTIPLPSKWSTGGVVVVGGENYTWKATMVDREIEPVTDSIDPWSGIPDPYQFSLSVLSDSDSINILNKNKHRSSLSRLTTYISAAATTINVVDTSSFAASGYLYIGGETIKYTGKTSTSFTGCTRGRFGSPATGHITDEEISDHPLTSGSRRVRIYVGNCTRPWSGQATPFADTAFSSDDRIVHVGYLIGTGTNLNDIKFSCMSLNSAYSKMVGNLLPSGTTISDPWNSILIDEYSNKAAFDVGGVQSTLILPIPDGIYQLDRLQTILKYNSYQVGAVESIKLTRFMTDNEYRVRVTAVFVPKNTTRLSNDPGTLYILDTVFKPGTMVGLWLGEGSFWRQIGFTEETYVEGVFDPLSDTISFTWIGGVMPALVMPKAPATRPVLVAPVGLPLNTKPQADGKKYIRVKEELMEVGSTTTQVLDNGKTVYKMNVTKRAVLGSKAEDEELLVPYTEPETIVVPVSVSYMPWPEAMLRLLISGSGDGSTYDKDWIGTATMGGAPAYGVTGYTVPGWGAGIPSSYVDVSSFTDAIVGSFPVSVCVSEPVSFQELVEPWLVASQHYLAINSSGQIELRKIITPMDADIGDAITFDQSQIATVLGVDYNSSEQNIVNRLVVENCSLNWGTMDDGKTITFTEPVSTRNYGAGKDLKVDGRAFGSLDDAENLFDNLAATIFGKWSSPFTIIKVFITGNDAFTINLGDQVSLSHVLLPDTLTATTGQTAVSGMVIARQVSYSGNVGAVITIITEATNGIRKSHYCPAARVTSLDSKTGELFCESTYYAYPAGTKKDVEYFEVDMRVRAVQDGDWENSITTTVTLVDSAGSIMTINDGTPLTWTPPFTIMWDDFDTNISDTQRLRVYIADGAVTPEKLDDGSADYNPFGFA